MARQAATGSPRRRDPPCGFIDASVRVNDNQEQMLDLFPSRTAGPFGRPQKHARGGRIPVTVVTGFLGAGKTTLVRRFLSTPEGRGTAVIVNEFGAIGIDDALVRASADETVLLGNGCVCCAMRSDLQLALRRLVAERERGTVPHFGRVVIETSGLADPGPILQTFATDRALGGEFHAELTLAVVDAVAGPATLRWSAEARKQATLADRLIVTKTDLAEPSARDGLIERLRALNPLADLVVAINGEIDPSSLTDAPACPPAARAQACRLHRRSRATATALQASCSPRTGRSRGTRSRARWRR